MADQVVGVTPQLVRSDRQGTQRKKEEVFPDGVLNQFALIAAKPEALPSGRIEPNRRASGVRQVFVSKTLSFCTSVARKMGPEARRPFEIFVAP